MSLQQIIDVDEKNEILHTSIWLDYQWTDYRFVWNSSDFGGVKTLRIPIEMIWRPDILLYDSVDEDIDSTYQTNAVVSSTGDIAWVPPGVFSSSCSIYIQWFPFDHQLCSLKFGSWTYDGTTVNLVLLRDTVDLSTYQQSGEWELKHTIAELNTYTYQCCPEPYQDITFKILLKRRSRYYILNLIAPCLILSFLALFNFHQPPENGEKIGLGVTILLSLSVFQLIIADMLPTTSTSLPVIATHFCIIMGLCTLSLIMTIMALTFHHAKPQVYSMPRWVRVGICQWLAWFLRMERPGKDLSGSQLMQEYNDYKKDKHRAHVIMHDIMKPSTVNAFLSAASSTPQEPQAAVRPSFLGALARSVGGGAEAAAAPDESSKVMDGVREDLKALLVELRYMTQKIKEDDSAEDLVEEWQFAAQVVDRLCFWVCSFAFIGGTMAIFLCIPDDYTGGMPLTGNTTQS